MVTSGGMPKPLVVLLFSCLAWPSAVLARSEPAVCGTHREKAQEELFLHRQAVKHRLSGRLQPSGARPGVVSPRDIGHIALIDDADGVVGHFNPFDLNQ